tara:strand:+ start:1838 stop:3760 length:1923 start_codon:yes stop_codon:yes gene_type:complete
MAIKLGSSGISKLYLGSTEATKVYLGSVEVYPAYTGFAFSVDTTKPAGTLSTQFQLPLISSGTISMDVDWGDGTTDTITTYNQAETLHTYSTSGTYNIEITNEVRGWQFNNSGDRQKITNIYKWGDFNFTDNKVFYGCKYMTCTATDVPTISTTDLQWALANCEILDFDATGWNVSLVTNFNYTFFFMMKLVGTGFDTLDMSSAQFMTATFFYDLKFNGNIGAWNLASLASVNQTFQNCPLLNPNLVNWSFPNLTTFNRMFQYCTSFTGQGVSNWNVSNVTNMNAAFNGCTNFDQNLSSWDINQVTNFSYILFNTGLSTANYDALLVSWEAQAPQINMTPSFGSSTYTLGSAAATARASLISTYGWTITDGGGIANLFTFSVNTANAGTLSTQFQLPLFSSGAISMDVDWGDGTTDTITSYNQAETLHTYASSGTYTISIENEVRGWRFNNSGDKAKIIGISNWGDFNFTNDKSFYGCLNMTCSATDAPTISATNITYSFHSCYQFNGTVNNWDVSSVINIHGIFYDCPAFNQPVNNWDTGSIISLANIFYNCQNFDQDISSWDVADVTNAFWFMQGPNPVTLSVANYDALLIGWENQIVQNGLSIYFGNSKYTLGSAAATARASLISTYGWTITDGGGI